MIKGVSGRQKNQRQIQAIFIGRKCVLSIVMFAMILISLSVAFFATNSFAKKIVMDSNKYFVSSASTIIGVGENSNFLLDMKKSLLTFFNMSETKDNISVVPVF